MFDSLDAGLQNILLFNHQFYSNAFILLFVMAFSFFYLFVYKPKFEKKTVMKSVMVLRLLLSMLCICSIFFSPFLISIMKPSVEENAFVNFYTIFYFMYLGIAFLVLVVDLIQYVPAFLINMMGVDIQDPDMRKFIMKTKKEINKLPFVANVRK